MNEPVTQPMVLEAGRWYGWQMNPGYGIGFHRYFSPIRMQEVTPLKTGRSVIMLRFWNTQYAEGVQDFTVDLRIHLRAHNYLTGALIYHQLTEERSAIINEISLEWLSTFAPHITRNFPPDPSERTQGYLARVFGITRSPSRDPG